jgi:allantoicase
MGDGWETRRRRDRSHDWVLLALAGEGQVLAVEVDTSCFLANAPGWFELVGGAGEPIMPRTRLQPDTRHRYRLPPGPPVTRVRINVYPDGGLARLRLVGRLTPAGQDAVALRWFNALPDGEARRTAADAAAARPLTDPAAIRRLYGG